MPRLPGCDREAALAEVANDSVAIALRAAPPVTLHTGRFWRADGNSPVLSERDGVIVFFSDYQPRGRTFRRRGQHAGILEGEPHPIRLIDDPDPRVGKWIEAVWRDSGGALRGWYHAEEPAPCPTEGLFLPHIGEAISQDEGSSWRCRGELLRVPADQVDCSWHNGFFVGGYGDLSVIPDRGNTHLYLALTSYLRDESNQGVVMARLPADRTSAPVTKLELWCDDGWRNAADGNFPKPLWPTTRGWRHVDPDGFWGPAVHFNEGLDAYVMLLNRTAGGHGDFVQEGIYASINQALDNPGGWSTPLQFVRGGAWYPQVVGLGEGQGDTKAGPGGRFFMGGFSAWDIDFSVPTPRGVLQRPLSPTAADFARLFGAGRRCPW
jgi:hypothetical protein